MYLNRNGLQLSRKELFSTSFALANVIHPVLIKYRELAISVKAAPSTVAEHFEMLKEDGNYDVEECHQQWVHCLDGMIWAFDPESDPVLVDPSGTSEIYEEYCIKRQEGLNLFATFFNDLWV